MNIYMKNLFCDNTSTTCRTYLWTYLTISLSVSASVLRGKRLYLSNRIFSYAYVPNPCTYRFGIVSSATPFVWRNAQSPRERETVRRT